MFIIGDVHGKKDEYLALIKDRGSSVQLGDMGFDYSHLKSDVKMCCHNFIFGNHDNYSQFDTVQNNLGNFGVSYSGGHYFFFIRGASSVDRDCRVIGHKWFEEEELNNRQAGECIDLYTQARPRLVLSHDCPQVLAKHLWGYPPTYTRKLLDNLLSIHSPHIWVFGHHHTSIDIVYKGVRFICLNELETIEL